MAYLRQKNIFDQFGLSGDFGMGMDDSSSYDDYDQSPSRSVLINRGPIDQPRDPTVDENPPPYQEEGGGPPKSLDIKPLRVQTFADSQKDYDPQNEIDLINKVFTPSTTDRDRLRGLLDNPPQREEPGFGRSFAAALVGLGNKSRGIPGGIAEQEKVLYAPYLRQMADWKEKITPSQAAAQYENTANAQERSLATTAVNASIAARRSDQMAEAARQREETARSKQENDLKIAQIRAAAFDAKRQGAKFQVVNGTLVATYPDGTSASYGDAKVWSDAELLNLQHDLKVDEMKQQAAISGPTGTNPADPKKADEVYQIAKQRALEYFFSTGNEFVKKGPTGYELAQKPVLGSGYPWNKVTKEKIAKWYEVARNVFPNMPPPPELTDQGGPTQPQSIPQPDARGLAPSQIPVPTGTSAEDRTRADIANRVNYSRSPEGRQAAMQDNLRQQAEKQKIITDPNAPNVIKQAAQKQLEGLMYQYNQMRGESQQPQAQGQDQTQGAPPRFDVQGGRINLPQNATPEMAADAADLATNKAVLAVDAQGLQHVVHVIPSQNGVPSRIPDVNAAITYALGKGWKVIPISR